MKSLMILVFYLYGGPVYGEESFSKTAKSKDTKYETVPKTPKSGDKVDKTPSKLSKPDSKADKTTTKPSKPDSKADKTTTKPSKPDSKADKTTTKPSKPDSKADKTTPKPSKPDSKAGKATPKPSKPDSKADKTTPKPSKPDSKADKTPPKPSKPTDKADKTTPKPSKPDSKADKTPPKPSKPTKPTDKADKTTPKPTEPTDKADKTTPKPTEPTDKADKTTPKPTEPTDKADKTTLKPSKPDSKEGKTTPKSSKPDGKADKTTPKPSEPTDKADKTTPKPSESTDKPDKTPPKPSESMDKEVETESKSSESMNKEGETAPKTPASMEQEGQEPVTKKIKQVFKDFIEILETESLNSEEYRKAVKFLEDSLYNSASFETLKLLATVYKDKGDLSNHIKVLKVLSTNHFKNPEPFYLLGVAHTELYNKEKEKRPRPRNKKEKEKKKNKLKKYRTQSVDYFNQALKVNAKYVLAYKGLLELFKVKHPKTDEQMYNRESLSVIMDMLRVLRKSKYYILLCQAYYDNNFMKQSRKACEKSVKINPNDPISHLLLVLSQPESKEKRKNVLEVAAKFRQSFIVQYKTAFFFKNEDPQVAITHFERAYAIQPDHLKLNEIMAKFLFNNDEEEKSQKHFLNVCLFTEGQNLKYFKAVTIQLYSRKKEKLVPMFQEGIDKCFRTIREKLRDNKVS